MKSTRIILAVMLVIVILSACEGSPSTAPTPTVAPTPTPVLLGNYALFEPEDLHSDIDELFRVLEAVHPNPYAKRTKQDVDLERQRLYQEFSQPITDIDFYKKISPLVNSLGDYHTNIYPHDETLELILKSELFFPFRIQLDRQRAYIIKNYSGNTDIEYGTELLEVNGISATILIDQAKRLWPTGRYIDRLDFWFVLGSSREYQMKLLPPNKTTSVSITVRGLTEEEMSSETNREQAKESVQYTTLPGEEIGLLTINDFNRIAPMVKRALLQVRKDQVRHLIIDLRANYGGSLIQADTTIKYLITQPYKICSQSYKAPFKGYGLGNITELACEQKYPLNIPEPYQGKLYVLVGPDTVSAAVIVASVLQDHKLATLIGEESNTPASMCADVPERASLAHTHLQYGYSRTCYVRPSGKLDDRGVVPDIIVETTIDDQIVGKDPVLNYTLEMIRNSE